MAQNDYHVIAYKILAYFYECLKSGKKPLYEEYGPGSELFDIPESYWMQVMRELIEQGYIRDMYILQNPQGFGIKTGATAAITMAGVEFLNENTMMQKAKAFLGAAFQAILTQIIARV